MTTSRLYPPLARYVVLAPTMVLSLALGSFGFPLWLRLATSVGFGAVLILLVARYQRRRVASPPREPSSRGADAGLFT